MLLDDGAPDSLQSLTAAFSLNLTQLFFCCCFLANLSVLSQISSCTKHYAIQGKNHSSRDNNEVYTYIYITCRSTLPYFITIHVSLENRHNNRSTSAPFDKPLSSLLKKGPHNFILLLLIRTCVPCVRVCVCAYACACV